MAIALQFVLGMGLPSQAIAWFSAGKFSHVDCVLPDGRLLGARSDGPGHTKPGVQIRPACYESWKQRVVLTLPATRDQEWNFYTFLWDQLGKPYDHTAIWGFVAGRDWRSAGAWFCSELMAAASEVACLCPMLYAPINKVMPAALALVYSALGATIVS